jgi:hypothetical protein
MFCTSCGKQLSDTQNFCTGCGKPVNNTLPQVSFPQNVETRFEQQYIPPQPYNTQPFQQQININIPPPPPVLKSKWETPRLIIGIITVVLFFLFQFQSCLAGVGESLISIVTLGEEHGTSGQTGYAVSFFFLIAGILSIVFRKNKNGIIAAGVIYALCGLVLIQEDFSFFADLATYCFLSFVFGAIMIIGAVIQKK